MNILEIIRIIFGSIYLLFLPGFVLSYVFFRKKEVEILERIALSFALSVAVVPLVVFYFNLVGVKITQTSVLLEVLGLILVALGIAYWRHGRNHVIEKISWG